MSPQESLAAVRAALEDAEKVFSVAFDGSVGSMAPCHDELEAIKKVKAARAALPDLERAVEELESVEEFEGIEARIVQASIDHVGCEDYRGQVDSLRSKFAAAEAERDEFRGIATDNKRWLEEERAALASVEVERKKWRDLYSRHDLDARDLAHGVGYEGDMRADLIVPYAIRQLREARAALVAAEAARDEMREGLERKLRDVISGCGHDPDEYASGPLQAVDDLRAALAAAQEDAKTLRAALDSDQPVSEKLTNQARSIGLLQERERKWAEVVREGFVCDDDAPVEPEDIGRLIAAHRFEVEERERKLREAAEPVLSMFRDYWSEASEGWCWCCGCTAEKRNEECRITAEVVERFAAALTEGEATDAK